MNSLISAHTKPEQVSLIGIVSIPVREDGFTVCVSDGPYRGQEFFVPEQGKHPSLGDEVEFVVVTESRQVISWKEYPNWD